MNRADILQSQCDNRYGPTFTCNEFNLESLSVAVAVHYGTNVALLKAETLQIMGKNYRVSFPNHTSTFPVGGLVRSYSNLSLTAPW